jgi:polyhydroxyalkanoate synthase
MGAPSATAPHRDRDASDERLGWCPDGPPPSSPPLPDPDPFGAGPAFVALWSALASRPALLLSEVAALGRAQAALGARVAASLFRPTERAAAEAALREALGDDPRLRSPEWTRYTGLGWLAAGWQLARRTSADLVAAAPGLDHHARRKATFFTEQTFDLLSPANAFWLNPQALETARATGGRSVLAGLRNWLADLACGDGLPNNADRDRFRVGRDLAVTPGRVVARTRLAEVIQYAPATDTVHANPLVIVPPWINKYYIMDLRPDNSFVRYLVDAGFTVYLISWKNPDESLREVGFRDYLRDGVLTAKAAAEEVTGEVPSALGFCLGGMLVAMAQAWLHGAGQRPFRAIAPLAAMVDFEDPGPIRVFIDERAVRHIERKMARRGFLTSQEMGASFAYLRGAELVWSYFVDGYLLGKTPPSFDMLAWNADGTRMPAAFHSDYLRTMYLHNRLRVPGAVRLDGVPLDLSRIREDAYVVASERDYIAPAPMSFRLRRYVKGPVRFVLADGGHVAGIIDPPARGKGWYEVARDGGSAADAHVTLPEWREQAERRPGSWWPDFVAWLAERSGPRGAAPPMGSTAHPPLAPAPGTYVLER